MKRHPFLVITVAALSVGCGLLGSNAILHHSRSLTYRGIGLYSDGGSLGFQFFNQNNHFFMVFVKSPYGGENEGIDAKGFQRVFVAAVREPGRDETLEIKPQSRSEARLTELVRTSLSPELSSDQREEVLALLEILKSRKFDWNAYDQEHSTNFYMRLWRGLSEHPSLADAPR
jgi:hypothetical protein